MNTTLGLSALAASTAIASVASAGVIVFDQRATWESFASIYGTFVFEEDFNDLPTGTYPTPFAQTTGPVNWSAVTDSGFVVIYDNALSSSDPESLNFTFSGSPLSGVGGNFYATGVSFEVVPALMLVTLSDGTSYAGVVNSASAFIGFYSTGASITSLSISAIGVSSLAWPTVDNLVFASVPAPGTLALLGLAGALTGRRRR